MTPQTIRITNSKLKIIDFWAHHCLVIERLQKALRPSRILDAPASQREVDEMYSSIQYYLYSAFHDTIVAKQLYRKLSL